MTASPLPNISLVFWNLDVKEPPHVDTVRDALRSNGLPEERAADIAPSTAFSRAAQTFKTKETEAKTYTSKETGRPRAQLDTLTEEDGRLRRAFLASFELDEDETPRHVAGASVDTFENAFNMARTHYTGADISKTIQAILKDDGLGAYSPRKNGGVYFVPVAPTAADLLSRIEKFAAALSVRFLVYSVPDTDSQRAEIADAICDAFGQEIDQHASAAAEYTTATRPGILENRRTSIQATYEAMGRLRNLMNGRYSLLQDRLRDALKRIHDIETARAAEEDAERERIQQAEDTAAETARSEGRRQIVNV